MLRTSVHAVYSGTSSSECGGSRFLISLRVCLVYLYIFCMFSLFFPYFVVSLSVYFLCACACLCVTEERCELFLYSTPPPSSSPPSLCKI